MNNKLCNLCWKFRAFKDHPEEKLSEEIQFDSEEIVCTECVGREIHLRRENRRSTHLGASVHSGSWILSFGSLGNNTGLVLSEIDYDFDSDKGTPEKFTWAGVWGVIICHSERNSLGLQAHCSTHIGTWILSLRETKLLLARWTVAKVFQRNSLGRGFEVGPLWSYEWRSGEKFTWGWGGAPQVGQQAQHAPWHSSAQRDAALRSLLWEQTQI